MPQPDFDRAMREGLADAVGFVGGALAGWWLGRSLGGRALAEPLPEGEGAMVSLRLAEADAEAELYAYVDAASALDPALFLLPGSINSNAPQMVTTASMAWNWAPLPGPRRR